MSLQPGDRLGAYEIVEQIGEGGMGRVYRALDTRLRRHVAIKVLQADSADGLARFEREAQAVAALSHPNVLQIHDFGSGDGTAWAVTELLVGETLRDVLNRGGLSRGRVRRLFDQMVQGVAAAHARGVVHRDLKPENVFVMGEASGDSGRVKILDFGLAKLQRTGAGGEGDATLAGATMPGTVLGTVGYMAPEQVKGLEADAHSDVFALGAILYEMLAGERAFSRPSGVETMSDILHRQPDLEEVPASWRAIVARCLDKDPSRRYASAGDLAAAVAALESVGDASHRGPLHSSSTGPAPLPSGSRPGFGSGLDASIAVLPFVNLSPDPDTEYFSDGVTDEIINALSQVAGLRVAARTSSFYFKGRNEPLQVIGERLQVASVLEGSVRRAGNRLRITAQLVLVGDGYQIWSEKFDGTMDDVFAVQDEIAKAIAQRLQASLAEGSGDASQAVGAASPLAGRDIDPKAYELFLKARFHHDRRSLGAALGCYGQVLEIEPDFAPAWSGVARVHCFDGLMARRPPRDVMPKAREAAERALALDPGLGDAYAALGLVHWLFDWDPEAADAAFRRGIDADETAAEIHAYYAFFLATGLGRAEEAVRQVGRAKALDPLSELSLSYEGEVLWVNGARDEAMAVMDEGFRLHPDSYLMHRLYGLACYQAARFEDAARHLEKALAESDRHTWCLVDLGLVRHAQGRRADVEALLEEAVEKAHSYGSGSSYLAVLANLLGEVDRAVELLEEAVESRDGVLTITRWWPMWASARLNPRLRVILDRTGL